MSLARFNEPCFWPTLVSYLCAFSIQLLTSNLHDPTPHPPALQRWLIPTEFPYNEDRNLLMLFATPFFYSRPLSHTSSLFLFVPSKLTLNSKTNQSGDALLLFRRRGRMRMLRRLLRVLYGLLLDNLPAPDFALLIHHATPLAPNYISIQNKR